MPLFYTKPNQPAIDQNVYSVDVTHEVEFLQELASYDDILSQEVLDYVYGCEPNAIAPKIIGIEILRDFIIKSLFNDLKNLGIITDDTLALEIKLDGYRLWIGHPEALNKFFIQRMQKIIEEENKHLELERISFNATR